MNDRCGFDCEPRQNPAYRSTLAHTRADTRRRVFFTRKFQQFLILAPLGRFLARLSCRSRFTFLSAKTFGLPAAFAVTLSDRQFSKNLVISESFLLTGGE